MEECKFNEACDGKCNNEAAHSGYCTDHSKIKCSVCGKQATHTCSETSQSVCGSPLCDDGLCILDHNYKKHMCDYGKLKEFSKKRFNFIITHPLFDDKNNNAFAKILNDARKGLFEVMIVKYLTNHEIIFYDVNTPYHFMSKDECIK